MGWYLAWAPSCINSLMYIVWVGSWVDSYFWQAASDKQPVRVQVGSYRGCSVPSKGIATPPQHGLDFSDKE